jgi:putative hydrolase of the HAD superfamily
MPVVTAFGEALTIRAVVFDFFGTLTRATQRGPAHATVPRRLGCDPAGFAAALDATFVQRITGRLGDPLETLAALAGHCGVPRPSTEVLRRAYADRIAAVRADIRLRPEAVGVLRSLRERGLPVGVISDCAAELPLLWPDLAVAPLVDVRVFSIEERRHKPDLHMYQAATERLGVDPADCLYVGDGDSHELTGASSAGMTAIRLAADDLSRHLVFSADDWAGPAVRTLTEVLDVVTGSRRPSFSAA